MCSNVYAILALPEREAQKLKISDRVHADHFALFRVQLQLELPFQVAFARFQKPLSGPLALRQNHDVVRIPDHLHASPCHLLIVFVQIDVRKKRAQRSSLR